MSQFTVFTPALADASSQIAGHAGSVGSAQEAASSAAGQAGAFGGEPIEGAFLDMCQRAQTATGELEQTMRTLAQNVLLAAAGYLNTDRGIVPVSALKMFSPLDSQPGHAL